MRRQLGCLFYDLGVFFIGLAVLIAGDETLDAYHRELEEAAGA